MLLRFRFPIVIHLVAIAAVLPGCASKGPQLTGGQPQVVASAGLARYPSPRELVFVPAYVPLKSNTPAAKKAALAQADQTASAIAQLAGIVNGVTFRLEGQQLSLGIKKIATTSANVSNRKVLDDYVVSMAIASRPPSVIQQMRQLDVATVVVKLPAPTPQMLDAGIREALRQAIMVFASNSPSQTPRQELRGELTIVDYHFIGGWQPSEIRMYVNVELRGQAKAKTRKRRKLPKNMPPALRRALEQP